MKTYRLEWKSEAPVGVGEAFKVFESPYNLSRITPPWLRFRITSEDKVEMRKGAVFTYTIRWTGVPVAWKTVITEYEPPFYFVDEQAAGPYRLWRHRHTFIPTENGTRVEDLVEYALPLGWLGRLAHRWMVRRQLEEIFAYRERALREIWREATASPAR